MLIWNGSSQKTFAIEVGDALFKSFSDKQQSGNIASPISNSKMQVIPPDYTTGGSFLLRDAEKAHIKYVLHLTKGKVSGKGGAAELLGVNRNTLAAKMAKLGIQAKREKP